MYNLAKCDVNAIERSVRDLDKNLLHSVMHLPSVSGDSPVPGKREALLNMLNAEIDATDSKPSKANAKGHRSFTKFEQFVNWADTNGWRQHVE